MSARGLNHCRVATVQPFGTGGGGSKHQGVGKTGTAFGLRKLGAPQVGPVELRTLNVAALQACVEPDRLLSLCAAQPNVVCKTVAEVGALQLCLLQVRTG